MNVVHVVCLRMGFTLLKHRATALSGLTTRRLARNVPGIQLAGGDYVARSVPSGQDCQLNRLLNVISCQFGQFSD